jgi:hypothetical protein
MDRQTAACSARSSANFEICQCPDQSAMRAMSIQNHPLVIVCCVTPSTFDTGTKCLLLHMLHLAMALRLVSKGQKQRKIESLSHAPAEASADHEARHE